MDFNFIFVLAILLFSAAASAVSAYRLPTFKGVASLVAPPVLIAVAVKYTTHALDISDRPANSYVFKRYRVKLFDQRPTPTTTTISSSTPSTFRSQMTRHVKPELASPLGAAFLAAVLLALLEVRRARRVAAFSSSDLLPLVLAMNSKATSLEATNRELFSLIKEYRAQQEAFMANVSHVNTMLQVLKSRIEELELKTASGQRAEDNPRTPSVRSSPADMPSRRPGSIRLSRLMGSPLPPLPAPHPQPAETRYDASSPTTVVSPSSCSSDADGTTSKRFILLPSSTPLPDKHGRPHSFFSRLKKRTSMASIRTIDSVNRHLGKGITNNTNNTNNTNTNEPAQPFSPKQH
ncbi:hypothetical protein GQ54DRAFT_102625 [Martensiomyces pterosporus]|nr:hypothetical protein GQ54DRAFT_102625 [Martensiomyces pterosporus]